MNRRNRLNDLEIRPWMRFTKSWFVCNPPPRTAAQRTHPAKFPESLARDFIEFFTRPGETVLDLFSGVESAVVAAASVGRRGIGIEISQQFHDIAEANREFSRDDEIYLIGDSRDAVEMLRARGVNEVHYLLTSPPYWDMLRNARGNVDSTHRRRSSAGLPTEYTKDDRDLGRIAEYDDFISGLARVLADIKPILAPARYLTVVIQNVRVPDGRVRPLAWDLVRALSETYAFKGERIWLQDNKRLGCWGWPSEFVTNVHHHYCMVFKNV